jgi:superfamily II DNA or RNA helicase
MNIILSSTYMIPKELVVDPYREFYVPNPQFGKYSKEPENLYYFDETPSHFCIPRNCSTRRFLRQFPDVSILDIRSVGDPLDPKIKFLGKLKAFQEDVVREIISRPEEDEIVESPCGSGKTVIGLAAAVRYGRKVAVLVPTEQLMEQWVNRVKDFLGYDAGVYYSEKKDIKDITIFSIASMFNKEIDPADEHKIFDQFGFVICDETHRLGALKWGNAAKCFKAKKRLGLTATPNRPDGLDVLMHFHIGEVRTRIRHDVLVQAGIVLVPDIITINFNGPKSTYKTKRRNGEFDFVATCNSLATSDERNILLGKVIKRALEFGRKTLVLINRLSHVEAIQDQADRLGFGDKIGVMKGGTKNKEEVFSKDVIIGMLSLVKEGLDLSTLDTVVIAVPVSDYGMVEQILGRVSRVDDNKRQALVIDIHDTNSKPLMMMAYKRINVYKRLKCKFRNAP